MNIITYYLIKLNLFIPYKQKTVVEECPCTEEDWECDFGFYRKDNEGDCIPINDHYSKENLSNPPADCVWSYMISRVFKLDYFKYKLKLFYLYIRVIERFQVYTAVEVLNQVLK